MNDHDPTAVANWLAWHSKKSEGVVSNLFADKDARRIVISFSLRGSLEKNVYDLCKYLKVVSEYSSNVVFVKDEDSLLELSLFELCGSTDQGIMDRERLMGWIKFMIVISHDFGCWLHEWEVEASDAYPEQLVRSLRSPEPAAAGVMNIFDWVVVATTVLAMVSWPIVLMRPSWLAIKKTWTSRFSLPIFLILSIAHAGFSTSTTVYFYMKEFYWEASHVNSPGIVDVLLWIGIPLFVLMLSLPLYLLLKYFAVKYEAWDTQHS